MGLWQAAPSCPGWPGLFCLLRPGWWVMDLGLAPLGSVGCQICGGLLPLLLPRTSRVKASRLNGSQGCFLPVLLAPVFPLGPSPGCGNPAVLGRAGLQEVGHRGAPAVGLALPALIPKPQEGHGVGCIWAITRQPALPSCPQCTLLAAAFLGPLNLTPDPSPTCVWPWHQWLPSCLASIALALCVLPGNPPYPRTHLTGGSIKT